MKLIFKINFLRVKNMLITGFSNLIFSFKSIFFIGFLSLFILLNNFIYKFVF